jgi:hypothetical protein
VIRVLLALLLVLGLAPADAQVIWGGAGSGAAIGAGSYWYYTAYPNVTLTGTQSEAVMFDVPVPANVLGPVGMLRITTSWSMTNNTNNKIGRVRWALTANNVTGSGVGTYSVSSVAVMQAQGIIRNANATNSQTMFPLQNTNNYATSSSAFAVAAIDTTQISHLTVTGTLTVGTDTLTLTGVTVEALHP